MREPDIPDIEPRLFLIVFDLAGEVDDVFAENSPVLEALSEYLDCERITRSTWIVNTRRGAADVLESVDQHLTREDSVFVARVARQIAWRNAIAELDRITELTEADGAGTDLGA